MDYTRVDACTKPRCRLLGRDRADRLSLQRAFAVPHCTPWLSNKEQ